MSIFNISQDKMQETSSVFASVLTAGLNSFSITSAWMSNATGLPLMENAGGGVKRYT